MIPLTAPPLASTLHENPPLMESITYQVTGLVVVATALCVIWALLEIIGSVFKKRQAALDAAKARALAASASVATSASPAPVAIPAGEGSLTPEIVAAITAAIYATLGARARIQKVVPVEIPVTDWGVEGRRQIHSARKVR